VVTSARNRLGCLFVLLLGVTVVYYGLPVVKHYWSYYKLVDDMRTNARFAQTMTDEEMLRRLRRTVDELDLPDDAKRFTVNRLKYPIRTAIKTQYKTTIDLPFHRRVITFRPSVEVRQ
jgi:hypothetical protein